jgi:EpsI family protein
MTNMRTRVIVVIACLAAASIAVARADRPEQTPLRMSFALFPTELAGWQGVQRPFSQQILDVLGLDDYLSRDYVRADRTAVNVYVGYWKSQRQGDTMHSPQNCLPGSGWEPVSQGLAVLRDPRNPDGPPISVNRYVVQKGLDKQLVLYWYQSRGRVVASEYWSKIYLVMDAAKYNRTDAALVRVITRVPGTTPAAETSAEQVAVQFAGALLPELTKFLPE